MNTSWKYLAHFLTAALALVTVAPASRAQNLNVMGAVNVPFAFETGYHTLPLAATPFAWNHRTSSPFTERKTAAR
jgi:hypothetical protein